MQLGRVTRGAQLTCAMRRVAVVAQRITPTNRRLVEAACERGEDARLLTPLEATRWLRPGDVALGRLDVLPTLDGVEPGLEALRRLAARAVDVRNGAATLLDAHDKLATALRLGAAGVTHPRTAHVDEHGQPDLELPVVVKPRFGSWGRDVTVCRSRFGLRRALRQLHSRPWFRRQGALVQELVPPRGHDLRVLVARGEVVGAIQRVAAHGEWRTNVALGGERRSASPPPDARSLAVRAARAIGGDLVGIDLLPDGHGGWVVLEVNGAVDFTGEYGLDGDNVFERAIDALLGPRYARRYGEETEASLPAVAAGARA